MANILEFLRGVLTDADAQGAFRTDPTGFLEREGFADLTGEDVVEGVLVLRRSLPAAAASALTAFEDEDQLPPVRPAHDEPELAAAARLLRFAADQVPVAAAASRGDAEEPAPTSPPPAARTPAATSPSAPPVEAAAPPAPPPVTVEATELPSVAAYTETLAAVSSDARSRLDDAVTRFVADAEAQVAATSDRFAELLRQAEDDASDLRATAEAEAGERRAEADRLHGEASRAMSEAVAARASAHEELERSRQEADELLRRAREEAGALRRQAEELLAEARAEAEAIRHDLDARRAEMRDAERQLKERLTGIDSLFRTVLRDEDGDPG